MTQTTPQTPQELLELNQKEVFAKGLTNVELVEKVCHHSDLKPTDIVEITKLLVDKLLMFHENVTVDIANDNNEAVPAHELFWVQDITRLQTVKFLMKNI